jgi:hypothetical protein
MAADRKREPDHDPALVAALAERVYREKLGPKDVAAMLAQDGDGGAKLHRRAQGYAPIVRLVLTAIRQHEAAAGAPDAG